MKYLINPFNPKWYTEKNNEEKFYSQRDIEMMNNRIEEACQKIEQINWRIEAKYLIFLI